METTTSAPKARVTTRALTQRIKRALSAKGAFLRKSRGERTTRELGAFFIVDAQANTITATRQSLEELGRELKVLADFEALADG